MQPTLTSLLAFCFFVVACGENAATQNGSPQGGSGGATGSTGANGGTLATGGSGSIFIDPDDNYQITGTTYFADAVNGSDANPGSKVAPFKTVVYALGKLQSGDALLLFNGDYGSVGWGRTGENSWEQAPIDEVYSDWVTVKAVAGQVPHIANLSLGTWNEAGTANALPFTKVGNSNLRMRFDGLMIDDGVEILGSRYVEIRNCTIQLQGDLRARMEDAGVTILNGQHMRILGNNITHSGIGISAMTTDLVIRGNEIHHNSHDGLSILGGTNWLVENNVIHDLDDGANDDEGFDWNRHVDGTQMYMVNNGDPKWAIGSTHFVFRGNVYYHLEAMGVMINANEAGGRYSDFTWENNVFGPVGGRLFILGADFYDGCVFRHNTVVHAPLDTWTSIWGRSMGQDGWQLPDQEYHVQVWGGTDAFLKDYQFYNNIFTSASTVPSEYGLAANNLFYGDTDEQLSHGSRATSVSPYIPVPGNIQDFIDQGGILGQLTADSIAIDAGTLEGTLVPTDRTGKARDAKPDVGALEL